MKQGEVFAIDLRAVFRQAPPALHGKHIVAWCDGTTRTKDGYGNTMYRFGVADALFDAKPSLAEVRKRKLRLLAKTFQNDKGLAGVYRLPDHREVERGVALLGELSTLPALTPKQVREGDFGEWYHVALDWSCQWRHDHDHASMQRERDAAKAKQAKADAAAQKKRRAGGLVGLSRRTLAPELTGLISASRATGLRAILKSAIADQLRTPPRAKKQALAIAVSKLNAFNDKHGGFIETPEREALMVCLDDIAALSGLGEVTEELNDWRDW